MIRTLAGVLLAPLAITVPAFLYVGIVLPALWPFPGSGLSLSWLLPELGMAVIGAYAGMLVLGLPAHIALRSRGRVKLRDYATTGACLAAVPILALLGENAFGPFGGNGFDIVVVHEYPDSDLPSFAYWIVAGATVASAFWFVSVRK